MAQKKLTYNGTDKFKIRVAEILNSISIAINPAIKNLEDVNLTDLKHNQILKYNNVNSRWENSDYASVDLKAGDGIDIVDDVISTETRLIDITQAEYNALSPECQNDPSIYYNITDGTPDKLPTNCFAVRHNTDKLFVNNETLISKSLDDSIIYKPSSSFLYITQPFRPKDDNWDIVVCFKAISISSTNTLLGVGSGESNALPVIIEFQVINGKNLIYAYVSESAGAWKITLTSTTSIETDKQYWVNLKYQDGIYSLLLSTDGKNYDTESSVTSDVKIVDASNSLIYLGSCCNSTSFNFNGYLYIDNSYIKINDLLWWGIKKTVYGLPFDFGINEEGFYGYYKGDDFIPFPGQSIAYKWF